MRNSINAFYNTIAKKSTCKFIKDSSNPRKRKSPNYSVDGTTSHGTIIQTGITFKKIPCYTLKLVYTWIITSGENAKIFRSYFKHFLTFPLEKNRRILTGLFKQVFMNCPIVFHDWGNKGKLMPASFSFF